MDDSAAIGERERAIQILTQLLGSAPSSESVMGKRVVVKLGGSALGEPRQLLQDCLWLRALGCQVVIVHGGGPTITSWLETLQIPVQFKNGLRVTDASVLEVVRNVLGGINQRLVELARRLEMGSKIVGLSGLVAHLFQAHVTDPERGFVGEINAIAPGILTTLLARGCLPILAPLGEGPDGTILNINADQVAAALAAALEVDALIFVSDVAGISSADDELIAYLGEDEARHLLAQGVIRGGMIPKIQAALSVVRAVPRVQIIDGREPHLLVQALCACSEIGTLIEPRLIRRSVLPALSAALPADEPTGNERVV
jgi:acetylglutamate kinase